MVCVGALSVILTITDRMGRFEGRRGREYLPLQTEWVGTILSVFRF